MEIELHAFLTSAVDRSEFHVLAALSPLDFVVCQARNTTRSSILFRCVSLMRLVVQCRLVPDIVAEVLLVKCFCLILRYRTSMASLRHSCLMFFTSRVEISAKRPTVLNDGFGRFPQSFCINVIIVGIP
jgi:hypothetical protein